MFSRGITRCINQSFGMSPLLRSMSSSSAPSTTAGQQVQHDAKHRKFFVHMESIRDEALLTYVESKNGTIDLQHTFVPDAFRGKGIAAKLVEKALSYAAEKDLKVQLTCWYAAKYVEKNKNKIAESPSLKKLLFI